MKLNQLDEGLEAVLKNLDTQVKQLDGVKPADNTLTSLSKKLFDENAMKIAPSEGQMKNIVDDIVKNGDNVGSNAGSKTEELSDLLYVRNGFNKVDNIKLNGDQGFDGVYIKGSVDNPTEIIINEAKQMNNGAVKLSPANLDTQLPAQMSDDWIDNVILRMENANVDGQIINSLRNNKSKITKVVTTVNKSTGEINILKLLNY